jgi:hypothetical protein
MDSKPKSNKIKRLERRRKREERADRRSREHTKKAAAARIIPADQALKGSDSRGVAPGTYFERTPDHRAVGLRRVTDDVEISGQVSERLDTLSSSSTSRM